MKEILLQRRKALRQALAGDDSLLKELNQQGGDVVDFALDSAYGELNCQLAEASSQELQAVENALSRMQEGAYGKCEACGCNIPLQRLQVLPYATFCVECKRLAEKAGVEPGSVVDWSVILEAHESNPYSDLDFNIS